MYIHFKLSISSCSCS